MEFFIIMICPSQIQYIIHPELVLPFYGRFVRYQIDGFFICIDRSVNAVIYIDYRRSLHPGKTILSLIGANIISARLHIQSKIILLILFFRQQFLFPQYKVIVLSLIIHLIPRPTISPGIIIDIPNESIFSFALDIQVAVCLPRGIRHDQRTAIRGIIFSIPPIPPCILNIDDSGTISRCVRPDNMLCISRDLYVLPVNSHRTRPGSKHIGSQQTFSRQTG